MRYIPILCLLLPLAACDNSPLRSVQYQNCLTIAQSRLKHPDSFDLQNGEESIPKDGMTHINLTFSAWNGYKVPIPHNIDCAYQATSEEAPAELLAIKWNGRAIRQHELDEIKENFK